MISTKHLHDRIGRIDSPALDGIVSFVSKCVPRDEHLYFTHRRSVIRHSAKIFVIAAQSATIAGVTNEDLALASTVFRLECRVSRGGRWIWDKTFRTSRCADTIDEATELIRCAIDIHRERKPR